MESIELKSQTTSNSRFCDSNVNETQSKIQTCLNIENDSLLNQSLNQTLVTEDNRVLNTFSNSSDLEYFITRLAKSNNLLALNQKISLLISQANSCIKADLDFNSKSSKSVLFKRKNSLFTFKSIEAFQRIIEKKFYNLNLLLVKYFELVLLFDNVSELSSDKDTIIMVINTILHLIKFVDNYRETNLLDYRLQILIKKVLVSNSDSPNEAAVKDSLFPYISKEDTINEKKKLVSIFIIF